MAGRFSFQSPGASQRSQPWFTLGQLDVTTTMLVVLLSVASMFVWAIDTSLLEPLALISREVLNGEVWRILTWPIPNEPDLWTVITIAIFWYFGRELEGLLGRNRYAWFLVILTVVPGIVGALVGLNEFGIRSLEFAVFIAFILEYPYARFFFGIPAWALGAVFVGLEMLQRIGLRDSEGIIFLLVSLATAAIAARSYGLASSLPWIPQVPLPGASTRRSSAPSRSRRTKAPKRPKRSDPSPSQRVVEGPWRPSAPPPPPSPDRAAAQAELDELLDKIAGGGMDSLSEGEKRRLNELSKQLRNG